MGNGALMGSMGSLGKSASAGGTLAVATGDADGAETTAFPEGGADAGGACGAGDAHAASEAATEKASEVRSLPMVS
ncbi:MAG TPA: hypothetical protein VMS65_06255 [Polyangiaceae bacterium]|nr:hypothetical protein [Polyangiaceae bacterium]